MCIHTHTLVYPCICTSIYIQHVHVYMCTLRHLKHEMVLGGPNSFSEWDKHTQTVRLVRPLSRTPAGSVALSSRHSCSSLTWSRSSCFTDTLAASRELAR